MKDNVAGKLRRYTTTTLHEYKVVLAGYVGSVVVPRILVSAVSFQLGILCLTNQTNQTI